LRVGRHEFLLVHYSNLIRIKKIVIKIM